MAQTSRPDTPLEAAMLEPMSRAEQADTKLLDDAHLASGDDLPRLFQDYGTTLGLSDVEAFLVDLQQRVLVPYLGALGPRHGVHVEALGVDSTLAGRTFQQAQVISQDLETDDSAHRVWLPLLDGTERIGVLAVTVNAPTETVEDPHGPMRTRLKRFATLAAELIMSKTHYGDTIVRLRRTSSMGLAAEMQWSLLPPQTFAIPTLTIAAGMEPAYEVGGDCFDYAVDDGTARFAIFDGMGHGLQSAQLAAVAVAGYRNGRRSGRNLANAARSIDKAVDAAFAGEAFSTGILAELDIDSGALAWVNAGHPAPLLVREGRLVKHLDVDPQLPFGIAATLGDGHSTSVGTETLQPADILILYSDGVVEARSPGGDFFGIDRLVDLASRNIAAGLPAPETMRRIVRSLLEHQQGQLSDDASLMLVQWRPDSIAAMVH